MSRSKRAKNPSKLVSIESAKVLRCSHDSYVAVKEFSEITGIPMSRIVDDAITDAKKCVFPAYLAARKRAQISRIEKKTS
jgi:hypothetical protein